jgi:hypothetical protein
LIRVNDIHITLNKFFNVPILSTELFLGFKFFC